MIASNIKYIEEFIQSSLPEIEKSFQSIKLKGFKNINLSFNEEGLIGELINYENELSSILLHSFDDFDVSLSKDYIDSLGINLDKYLEDFLLSEEIIKNKDEEAYYLLKKEKIIQEYVYSGYLINNDIIEKIESSN